MGWAEERGHGALAEWKCKGGWVSPVNHGKVWTQQHESVLAAAWRSKMSVEDIALQLGRLPSAVESRLVKMGLAEWDANGELVRINSRVPAKLPTASAFLQEKQIVNYNHLITLLQKGYTTCEVKFQDKHHGPQSQNYTYKVPTSLNVQPLDLVVVPVGDLKDRSFKVVEVQVVHPEPEIDVSAPYALKWVVCKVDTAAYDDQMKREEEAITLLRKGERKAAQERALAALMETVPNKEELMKLLGVA